MTDLEIRARAIEAALRAVPLVCTECGEVKGSGTNCTGYYDVDYPAMAEVVATFAASERTRAHSPEARDAGAPTDAQRREVACAIALRDPDNPEPRKFPLGWHWDAADLVLALAFWIEAPAREQSERAPEASEASAARPYNDDANDYARVICDILIENFEHGEEYLNGRTLPLYVLKSLVEQQKAALAAARREAEEAKERSAIESKMLAYIAFALTGDERADPQLAADRVRAALGAAQEEAAANRRQYEEQAGRTARADAARTKAMYEADDLRRRLDDMADHFETHATQEKCPGCAYYAKQARAALSASPTPSKTDTPA